MGLGEQLSVSKMLAMQAWSPELHPQRQEENINKTNQATNQTKRKEKKRREEKKKKKRTRCSGIQHVIPDLGKWKGAGPWNLLVIQSSLFGESKANEKAGLKNPKVDHILNNGTASE